MWWMAAAALVSNYFDGQNQQSQADYNTAVANANAAAAREQARRVIENGNKDANKVYGKQAQVGGAQRAGLAAAGIDLSSSMAMDLNNESLEFAIEDAQTIRNNAYLEAMGFEQQAVNYRTKADMDQRAVSNRRTSSLISTGLNLGATYAGSKAKSDASDYASKRG